jgi:hypothetical protein
VPELICLIRILPIRRIYHYVHERFFVLLRKVTFERVCFSHRLNRIDFSISSPTPRQTLASPFSAALFNFDVSSICACIQSTLRSASERSPGLHHRMSADAAHVARTAVVPVGQEAWAEALTRVEVLDIVERNIIRQEKLQKFLNVKSEFEF